MEDGKGEEPSPGVPENGWLGLWDCVRAQCRRSSTKFVFVLFVVFRRSGEKEIREPYYDGYSGLGQEKNICETFRYAEQLSWSTSVAYTVAG